MSAILSLPNEVLAKIFVWGTVDWWYNNQTGKPFPVTVGSVFSHWRVLSKATPELWKRIFVPFSQGHITPCEWVAEWLNNSAACRYTIIIDAEKSALLHTLSSIQEVMLIVGQHSSRLRHLEIRGWSTMRDRDLKIISTLRNIEKAPALESLTFVLVGGDSISLTYPTSTGESYILCDVPKLWKVVLVGVPEPPIPLNHLTYVDLQSLQTNFEEIRSFFEASPNLKTFVLHHLLPSPEPMSHQRHAVIVTSLRHLAVGFAKINLGRGTSYFFSYCKFTQLEYLELDGEIDFASALSGSLAPSSITTLKISNMLSHIRPSENNSPSFQFLHSMSSLRHIKLFSVPVSRLLTNDNAVGRPLERKRSLDLSQRMTTNILGQGLDFMRLDSIPNAAAPHKFWPALDTITVDSLVGKDIADLCNYLAAHRSVRKVRLSASSKKHLLHSVRRIGDNKFEVPGFRVRKWEAEGVLDALKWLENRFVVENIGMDNGAEGLL